jgi:hypothetical protein
MSSEKQVPVMLRHDKMERGHHGKNAPICYVPEQDPVQDSLVESTVSTNTVKMPGGTKTHLKVWNGQGANEAFLDYADQIGALIKSLGYWTASKAAKKEESKIRSKANASDTEKADVL